MKEFSNFCTFKIFSANNSLFFPISKFKFSVSAELPKFKIDFPYSDFLLKTAKSY